jgi:hypothetical protein
MPRPAIRFLTDIDHAAEAANDPRVTGLLRWSAGISGPLILASLIGIAGTLINLRDESRQMKYEIRQIATSDNKQEQAIRQILQEQSSEKLKFVEHKLRLNIIEAKLGLR